jgi:hypothetical protein
MHTLLPDGVRPATRGADGWVTTWLLLCGYAVPARVFEPGGRIAVAPGGGGFLPGS